MNRYHKLRQQAIIRYGGVCAVCGIGDYHFLTIDHVYGGGKAHLREIKTQNLVKWLAARNFPDGYQVLCWNHNYLKHATLVATALKVDTVNARWRRKRRMLNKQAAVAAYGGVCRCCGEADERLLVIDHIARNGAQHRRDDSWAKRDIYEWLRRNGYGPGFQLLCHNCNSGKEVNGGICPHVASG